MTAGDGWFRRISNNPTDLILVADMIQFYEKELDTVYTEGKIKISGSLERACQELPGIMAYRLQQLSDVQGISKMMEIQLEAMRSKYYRQYSDHYQRDLKTTEINRYIDGEDEVIAMKLLLNQVNHLVTQYLNAIRSYEIKHYQITNITKLRVAGMEDAILEV